MNFKMQVKTVCQSYIAVQHVDQLKEGTERALTNPAGWPVKNLLSW